MFVSIEMRQTPFFGWIKDLSVQDPTSILNLFGLLPYSTSIFPDFLNLGSLASVDGCDYVFTATS